jgi:hypothetical protein
MRVMYQMNAESISERHEKRWEDGSVPVILVTMRTAVLLVVGPLVKNGEQ